MSDLHKLVISAPDGHCASAMVTLDGQPIYCTSVTLRACAGDNLVSATIEFDMLSVEYTGMADVVARLVKDETVAP